MTQNIKTFHMFFKTEYNNTYASWNYRIATSLERMRFRSVTCKTLLLSCFRKRTWSSTNLWNMLHLPKTTRNVINILFSEPYNDQAVGIFTITSLVLWEILDEGIRSLMWSLVWLATQLLMYIRASSGSITKSILCTSSLNTSATHFCNGSLLDTKRRSTELKS